MENRIVAVSCLALAFSLPNALAEDCAVKSVFQEWHPTGAVRVTNGDLEQEYVQVFGCNGYHDLSVREYEFRKVESPRTMASEGTQAEFNKITLALTEWQPTANFRKVNGVIERQFEHRVGYDGNRDSNVSKYKWEAIDTAGRTIASNVESTREPGVESVLVDWYSTGDLRMTAGKFEQKFARTVGYNAQRDSCVHQYEWRPMQ